MSHLPDANGHQDECLHDGPPEDPLVGALAGLTETLLPVLGGGHDDVTNVYKHHNYIQQLR